ncbi:Nucleolar Complex 2 protein [Coemansia furcata]|uniref:Nucleolar Complex 2 protein n=1 Tax=Coemansia furcata TaxID=417177 RepID=A0ACC1LL35_9FUNG|nr:Nucleolar Complex 2 protein [Coemansia furcata]
MGKAKKSTKKFNQRHLKDELERRKEHKKTQKLVQKREVKKKRKANGSADDGEEVFTGVEEIDDLAGFAESVPKGALAKLDLSKFVEADPTAAGSDDASDDEDIAALLEGDDDDDDDDMPSDSDPEDDGSNAEIGGDDEDEDEDDEEAVFKRELEAVSKKDPKFLEFMKKNDPSSLAILEDNDEGSEEEEDDEEQDEGEDEQDEDAAMSDAEEPESSDATVVTSKMLEDWEKDITEKQSIKSLKRLLLALYSASHMESENESTPQTSYRIEGMRIFNKTVTTSIRTVPKAFNHYAPIVNDKVAQKSGKKWGIAQALIKSYLVSLLELLKQMSDAAMIQYLIKESERMIPYFVCFTRYTREFVKELLRLFGSASVDDGVRILALLSLRRLVSLSPPEVADIALKGIYLTYVRNSNVKTIANLTTIQLMRNCGVELYGNDANASYQHGFVYIRQLAIHLRNSMQLRSKESFRAIYNWQFINSLNFWTEVLATYCGDRAEEQPQLCATLESLVYPLTQIILGVARLVPIAKYFPLRIHCISQLLRLSSATGIYIPILPMIIEVLESPEFLSRRPTNSTLKPLSLDSHLKAPKEYEHTRVYLEIVLESVFGLLADTIAAQSVRIAFPEWVVPAVLQLRRWRKRAGKSWSRFSKQLQGLLEKIDQTSVMVVQRRNKVDFGPANLTGANQFMSDISTDATPIGAYASSLRKVKAQQRATMVEAEMEK